MPKYGKPIWKYVLEAAKELDEIFTASNVIRKIHEKNPEIPSNTIRCHCIGMSPNHPSSIHYPSILRNYPYFEYLGNGRYHLLKEGKQIDYPEINQRTRLKRFVGADFPKPFSLINRTSEKVRTMKERVDDLNEKFKHYLNVFDEQNLFSGPSLYFHQKTLERAKELGSVRSILWDETYLEYLYATLTSWGLHRMGSRGAKLAEFNVFKESLQNVSATLTELGSYKLTELNEEALTYVNDKLKSVLDELQISTSSTQLVAGSKALHHILPDLIPPIDRNYTIRFFYGKGGRKQVQLPYGGDSRIFGEIYPIFQYIGTNNKEEIQQSIGREFYTSQTKVIDNAIIGYVIENIQY